MGDDPTARTRTVHWSDPAQFADPIRTMSGLDFMRAFLGRQLPPPPIMELIGMRLVSVEPGAVAFEFDPAEFLYSPLGNVHGGVVTVLLDTAMGCSFHTTLPAGVGYTTIELKTHFLRPVTVRSGTLRAVGRVIHAGNRVAAADARLSALDGKLYAYATSSLLILRSTPPGGPPAE